MNIFRYLVIVFLSLLSISAIAEMKALEDEFLSNVSGQSGLTMDLEAKVKIGELAYFDDAKGIALQGIRLSSAADPNELAEYRFEFDILANGDLSLAFQSQNIARFEIEEIRFIDTPGLTPIVNDPSIGGIFMEYEIGGSILTHNRGNGMNGPNNAIGGLYDINFNIRNGKLGYKTNGNEFYLDGLELDVSSMGTILGVTPSGELNLSLPNFLAELRVDAIRFGGQPLSSYGSIWASMDLNSDLFIKAGGAEGSQGMTINANTTINRMDVAWGDDTDWANSGYWVGALGISGSIDLVNMTVDVLDDPDMVSDPTKDYGVGLALAFESLSANLHIDDLVIGETKTNIDAYLLDNSTAVKSVGSFDINLNFADGIYDTAPLTNFVILQAGGNTAAGYQGLRLDTQLSLVSPNNESNFVYTDDGSSIMLSRFEAFVDGDVTIDVTAAGDLNGTTFYDGMRVGFEDVAFGYRVEGYRVAESTGNVNDLKTREAQAAQSIPGLSGVSGLGGSPSLEGVLNGHITLGPGGNEGAEGITINSDISVTDGVMAKFIQADGSGNGVWLSGLNYDVHLRNMMLDVTNDGLKIYEGESWSKMDVTDFKIGGKDSGASFGRLILETYEVASETVISAGGAGTVCIGGVGSDAASCGADNGRWEDRGSQGLTIATKRHFKDKIVAEGKQNRITWETARIGEGTVGVANDTGMKLIFDNFTTNDGDGLGDTFGIQTEYNIDVAHTRVVKKTTGTDSNGVYGEKGWEKVMKSDGTYDYMDPATMSAADIANRPVGLAVRTNTQFKELDFERVNVSHPTGGESTLLYGLKLQNFDITTDITATPLN
jgi:hypothetical protein